MKVFCFSILLLLGQLPAHSGLAQTPGIPETIDIIQNILGPSHEFKVSKGYLSVKYFKDGELFREDEAACKNLNVKGISYDEKEGIFSMNCNTGMDCVVRVYHIKQIKRDYGRISIAVSLSNESAQRLQNAMIHLLKMINDSKYKEDVSL